MNKFILRQSLLLLLTAVVWGVAFVAQSVGMEYIGPFTFNAIRNLIGAVVLIPCIALLQKKNNSRELKTEKGEDKKELLLGGVVCGVLLCIASNIQQFGMKYTTVGKAGFITAMYIVIGPIFGIFLKKKAGFKVWIAVVIAVAGLYMLCMTEGSFSFQKGDLLVFCCAFVFSAHILTVDHFAARVDGVKMACIQFFTCSVLSAVGMLLFEEPDVDMILAAWVPILYAGALSCGVGYTLQIVGQRGMNPTVASLILSLESVVSVIAGWLILGQKLSARELMGCIFMFAAIILVQLPNTKRVGGLEQCEKSA